MRAREIGLILIGLVGATPAAPAAAEPRTESFLEYLKSHLRASLGSAPEMVAPQPVADDPGAPVVSLSRITDARALERQLRGLVKAPYASVRLRTPDGYAHVGNFSVGSAESLQSSVLVIAGRADVYGRVTGNVVALDGNILIHRGAVIEGDAIAYGGEISNLGGSVGGRTLTLAEPEPLLAPPEAGPVARVFTNAAGLVGTMLTLGLIGFGLVLFGKTNLEVVSDTVSHSFLRSFMVGLLSQVLVIPTFGMLVVGLVLSVVGVLLVPFVVVVYALLVVVGVLGGFLAVAHAMGETHTRRQMARGVAVSPNSFRYLGIGLGGVAAVWLAWVLFGWVPVAGTLILLAAVLATWVLATVGLGACVLSRAGIQPSFAGRYLPAEMLTDEYLWATPQQGVPAVKRPSREGR
ncbi:MAG: hypothetical protein JNJ80_19355 [Gemmatimonadetes bacterium]|nr:hypothetical protein [Gemmatimonadota bacterium]